LVIGVTYTVWRSEALMYQGALSPPDRQDSSIDVAVVQAMLERADVAATSMAPRALTAKANSEIG
jgi:hypothetical protein